MSSVLEMAFHRTSGCAPERGCCLLSFHNDIHHFLVIWGHWGLVTNPMIATIIQGGILLTALQDPHQQEKTYFCHLSFKMTEMTEGFKQLSRALWYTTSMSEGMLQSLSLVLWQDFSLFHWWWCPTISHCQIDGEPLGCCSSGRAWWVWVRWPLIT